MFILKDKNDVSSYLHGGGEESGEQPFFSFFHDSRFNDLGWFASFMQVNLVDYNLLIKWVVHVGSCYLFD